VAILSGLFLNSFSVPPGKYQDNIRYYKVSHGSFLFCPFQFITDITLSFDSIQSRKEEGIINPLNAELNPICHLLTLLGARHILHVSRIRVNSKYRDSYIYVHYQLLVKCTILTL
jgi:hypothetical protein